MNWSRKEKLLFELLGNSLATGKKYTFNPNNNTAILHHINLSPCIGKEDNFQIIGSAKSDELLCIKETLMNAVHLFICLSNYLYYLSILF